MGSIRERLYNAAERFDTFLDTVLKSISPRTRAALVILIGGLAAVAAWMGKYLLACILLGCGAALGLSR